MYSQWSKERKKTRVSQPPQETMASGIGADEQFTAPSNVSDGMRTLLVLHGHRNRVSSVGVDIRIWKVEKSLFLKIDSAHRLSTVPAHHPCFSLIKHIGAREKTNCTQRNQHRFSNSLACKHFLGQSVMPRYQMANAGLISGQGASEERRISPAYKPAVQIPSPFQGVACVNHPFRVHSTIYSVRTVRDQLAGEFGIESRCLKLIFAGNRSKMVLRTVIIASILLPQTSFSAHVFPLARSPSRLFCIDFPLRHVQ